MAIPKWIVFIWKEILCVFFKFIYVYIIKPIFDNIQKFYSLFAIAAIIFAGYWGWSTFQYLNLRASTLHISPEIELKLGESRKGRTPILADISIENTGKRKVYTFPGVFSAKGIIYEDRWFEDDEFQENLDNLERDQFKDRLPGEITLVAGGSLYVGSSLNPGETVHRSALLYVEEDLYDSIIVWAEFSMVNEPGIIDMEYKFSVKEKGYTVICCRIEDKKENCSKNICVKNTDDKETLDSLEYHNFPVRETIWLR
ncbi:MAG: hypothetical protein V3V61_03975 [Gammaproteobacteria bacterium]